MTKPEILPFLYDSSVLNDIFPELIFPITQEIKEQIESSNSYYDYKNFTSVLPYFQSLKDLHDGALICIKDDETQKRYYFVYLNDYGYKGVARIYPDTLLSEEVYIKLAETKIINGNDYELLHLLYEYNQYLQYRILESNKENNLDFVLECLNNNLFNARVSELTTNNINDLISEEIKSIYQPYQIAENKIFFKNDSEKCVVELNNQDINVYGNYGIAKRVFNMIVQPNVGKLIDATKPYIYSTAYTINGTLSNLQEAEDMATKQMVADAKLETPEIISPEISSEATPQIPAEMIADISNEQVQEEVKEKIKEQVNQALTENTDDELANIIAQQQELISQAMEQTTKAKEQSETYKINNPKSLPKEEIKKKKTKAIFTETPEKVIVSSPKISTDKLKRASEKQREIEKIGNSLYIPPDWDYVYSLAETSRAEDKANGIFGLGYNKEISNEEFNAYFIAHPEYDSIMDKIIGFITYTETELIKKGLLFYDAKEKKVKYRYEYLYGNGYELLDALELGKEEIIAKYGQEVYENQVQEIKNVIPEPKSIFSTDPTKIPYIHPLDDLVVQFKIKQAGDIAFTFSELRKRKAKKQAQAAVVAAEQEEFGVEDLETKQELSLVVFFKEYLKTVEGYLARYDLRDLSIVLESYFGSLSLKTYREYLVEKGIMPKADLDNIINIENLLKGRVSDKKSKKYSKVVLSQEERDNLTKELFALTDKYDCAESNYMTVKENVRKFSEDMFQRFLKEALNYDDQVRFDYEFNKTYNGVIRVDDQYKIAEWNKKLENPNLSDEQRQSIELTISMFPSVKKFPVFIRHSKYFKQRSKGAKFKLTQEQVDGIKFATITNSSIIAHEVGYGKSSLGVCYTSHLFETNQINNMLFVVPKSLYDNRKWEEELVGYFDDKRNDQTIGLIPQYNFVALGNMTVGTVFGDNGIGGLKNYDKTDLSKIDKYYEFIEEIGGKIRGRRQTKTGKGALPTTINFINALKFWVKLIDDLQNMDAVLFNRCAGINRDYYSKLISLYFGYSQTNKDLKDQLKLMDDIILLKYKTEYWDINYPNVPFNITDFTQKKNFYDFKKSEIGKIKRELANSLNLFSFGDESVITKNIDDFEIKFNDKENKDVASNYIIDQLGDIHSWLNSILVKMYEFGIYEYGNWNFNIKEKNIFLATRDALNYMGFSYRNVEALKDIVRKVTEYPLEDTSVEISEVKYVDTTTGEIRVAKSTIQNDLFRQQQDMIDKITENMTEEANNGKFFLENLGIDGLVVDEAHIAKKLFTGIKTQRSIDILQPDGSLQKITTNSHSIRGGGIPLRSLTVFGVCNYIKSLPGKKPIMLLSATPFTNQPTEIFSMLSLVGADQLRQYGIYNIKRFFDMFLKETLKYDFDHLGNFIKKVVIEDFRNKDILSNIIWSCMDIKRERQEEIKTSKIEQALLTKEEAMAAKPKRVVIPTFKKIEQDIKDQNQEKIEQVSISQVDTKVEDVENDLQIDDLNTFAEIDRYDVSVSSIVDRNKMQNEIMTKIEKWLLDEISFDDVCPNFKLFTDLALQESEQDVDVEQDIIVSGKKSRRRKKDDDAEEITVTVTDSGNKREGKVFKALGISRAVCLSPYLFKCAATEGMLPYPTPENLVKHSPKIEYVVSAIESIVRHHKVVVPREIKKSQSKIEQLSKKISLTADEQKELDNEKINLIRLENATEVSGQVIYASFGMKFLYTYRKNGKIVQDEFSIPTLIKQYLVNKGIFTENEVVIFDSSSGRDKRERAIKDFQDGKAKVFIGSPAMKEGVDLQNKGATMYILTPDWNPTDMRQIEGRIWRRGNEYAFVRIVYVLLDNSVEVFIYSKLEEKARRLAKIMKERNTIAELQEMSLDPNQTKVALMTDPKRRADMITKIKELTLLDRLAAINKNKINTFSIIDGFSTIRESIDELKLVWQDYNDLYPTITENYYKWVLKNQVELIQNDYAKYVKDTIKRKDEFNNIRSDFPYNTSILYVWTTSNILDLFGLTFLLYSKKSEVNDRFNISRWLIDKYRNEVKNKGTIEGQPIYDIRNFGMVKVFQKIIADPNLNLMTIDKKNWEWVTNYNIDIQEEKDKFSQEADRTNLWNNTLALLLKNNILDNINKDNFSWSGYSSISPFKPLPIMLMNDDIAEYAKETYKKIIDMVNEAGQGAFSEGLLQEQKIKQFGEEYLYNISVMAEKILVDEKAFTIDSNIRVKRAKDNIYKQIPIQEFEARPLEEQINILLNMFKELKELIQNFRAYSEETRAKITVGTLGRPTYEEIVVAMQLNELPKKGKESDAYQALVQAVDKIKEYSYKIRDIQRDVLRPRGLTMNDLDSVKQEIENDYNNINNKIKEVEKLKVELTEKYEAMKQMKENINTQDIVEQFSLTNHYLNYKVVS